MKHNYCVACGNKENLQHHHIIPKSWGGSDDETNLITLCGECHSLIHGNMAKWSTSELTSAALQHKKSNGEVVGRVPFGFEMQITDGKKMLIENEHEQAALKFANELRSKGESLHKIARL